MATLTKATRVKRRFHLFVDETGQDTRGQIFITAAVVVESQSLPIIRQELEALESKVRKTHRWARTSPARWALFLDGLVGLLPGVEGIFCKLWGAGTEYVAWTSAAVGLAAEHVSPYDSLTVVLDGGNWSEQEMIKAALRTRKLHWRKVSSANDEGEPLLRLADTMAGYFRDRLDGSRQVHRGIEPSLKVP